MLSKIKLRKLFKKYAQIVGIKDYKLIERIWWRGDVHQKKWDLVAIRATIYAKRHLKPNATREEQEKVMEQFAKTQNLKGSKFPYGNPIGAKTGQTDSKTSETESTK